MFASHVHGKQLATAAARLGLSQPEYIANVTGLFTANGLDFWAGYMWPAGVDILDPADRALILDSVREVARRFADLPNFRGLAYDEPRAPNSVSATTLAAFRRYLLDRHAPDELAAMGLTAYIQADEPAAPPAEYRDDPVLFMEYEEFAASRFESLLGDMQAALQDVRSLGASSCPVISTL